MGQSEVQDIAPSCPVCGKPDKPYRNIFTRMDGSFKCRKCRYDSRKEMGQSTDERTKVSGGEQNAK